MSSGAFARLRLRLDRLPQPLQEDEVALDVLFRRALGGGADDDAALLDAQLLEDVLAGATRSSSSSRRETPRPSPWGTKHDEAAGQRDLRRQPGALRLHRVLHRLDEDLLAAADQILDPTAVAALELRADDLVDVQEAVLLQADLDERCLHSGQHVVDDALVDVPGDRAALGPLEIDLGDAVVLEDGDALLADVDRDEQLALRGRQRRPARRCGGGVARAFLAATFLPLRHFCCGGFPFGASRAWVRPASLRQSRLRRRLPASFARGLRGYRGGAWASWDRLCRSPPLGGRRRLRQARAEPRAAAG